MAANGGNDSADAATVDTAETFLNSALAGSGPYILEKWEPSVETVLVRNENYWGDAPAIERGDLPQYPGGRHAEDSVGSRRHRRRL